MAPKKEMPQIIFHGTNGNDIIFTYETTQKFSILKTHLRNIAIQDASEASDSAVNIGEFFKMAQVSYFSEMQKESLILSPKDPQFLTVSSRFPPHLLARWNAPVTSTGSVYGFIDEDIQDIKNKLTKRQERGQSYSTLELIEDLMSELQKQPEDLAKISPERLYHFSESDFSQFWRGNNKFIDSVKQYTRRYKPEHKFKEKDMSFLKEKSVKRFGARALGLVEIIRQYTSNKLTLFEFVKNFKNEFGRISGDIKVTKTELSILFGMSESYISQIIVRLEDPSDQHYDPNFKFSKETLGQLTENLEVFKYSFKNALTFIEKYISLNPDLKDYSGQQYTVANPHFFSNIFQNIEGAYWFGFLCADGWLYKDRYTIGIELSIKDEDHLKKFADLVGFDMDSIFCRTRLREYKGEIKTFRSASVAFGCKPMAETLMDLGLLDSKVGRNNVPQFVRQAIDLAKRESVGRDFHWSETFYGKIAHAWLLGFYDGDGSYKTGNRAKYSACIHAASKALLKDIKDLFEIANEVLTKVEPGTEAKVFDEIIISGGFYSMALGPEVFKKTLLSYRESLERKRP